MFHRGWNVSISLPTFLLSPFLTPSHLLRENDLPFCLVNYRILVDVYR